MKVEAYIACEFTEMKRITSFARADNDDNGTYEVSAQDHAFFSEKSFLF
jgi:hypothetical protein